MGSADPRSYSRNKRGIAGSFVWINFDRNSLLEHFRNGYFVADVDDFRPEWASSPDANQEFSLNSQVSTVGVTSPPGTVDVFGQESELSSAISDQVLSSYWYADQVMPFDIVLVANNEYGASAKMKIIGVEILNDGLGVSVDDTVIESQSTFVARTILPFKEVPNVFRDPETGLPTPTAPGQP